jgi:hypothetical protein
MMMIIVFHQNLIFGYQILPKNTNVNFQIFIDFLEQIILLEVKNEQLHNPLILHDNAKPHKHQKVKEFFNQHSWGNLITPLQS